ncbi:hypothetical protein FA95DRAFT_765878 [Auriscalpium vulgare]|uniref:Uncharacterized protein n=1 Tax=Auriscalpium vulgare TaxID=40419 RepID=A0ACB8RB48_9AGAM|nr:hypothetical protein FA95DRAFT_765878 [Auriscalpium vulgare]
MSFTALWTVISSYLPSIRVYNDFDDAESDDGTASIDTDAYDLPTHRPRSPFPPYGPTRIRTPPPPISPPAIHPAEPDYLSDPHHPEYASASPHGQYYDRMSDIYPRSTLCEPPRSPASGLARLSEPARSRGFELWNAELMKKLKTLEDEMAEMQSESDADREELRMLREANEELAHQNSQLHRQLAEAYAWAERRRAPTPAPAPTPQPPPPPTDERDAELAALRSFHDKTDDLTGAELVQSVQDLNTEIMQLAAAVADEFPLARCADTDMDADASADCALVGDALGPGLLALLRDRDHADDPTVVQLAVQAWAVWACRQTLDAFCAGMPPDADRFMQAVFREMQASELQPVTSRWRALTHKHARTVAPALSLSYSGMSMSGASSALCSPIALNPLPTPPATTNNTPAPHIFLLPPAPALASAPSTSSTSSASPSSTVGVHALRALLALAGCTDPAAQAEPLGDRFGGALVHIGERAEKLARDVREGVRSAWFEVRAAPVRVPAPRGLTLRGLRGWAEDVGSEDGDDGQGDGEAGMFDPATMQNVYAGFGSEQAGVLCTTAFGLEMVRARKRGADSSAEGELERTLLLKPQVVLDSVTEFLDE